VTFLAYCSEIATDNFCYQNSLSAKQDVSSKSSVSSCKGKKVWNLTTSVDATQLRPSEDGQSPEHSTENLHRSKSEATYLLLHILQGRYITQHSRHRPITHVHTTLLYYLETWAHHVCCISVHFSFISSCFLSAADQNGLHIVF